MCLRLANFNSSRYARRPSCRPVAHSPGRKINTMDAPSRSLSVGLCAWLLGLFLTGTAFATSGSDDASENDDRLVSFPGPGKSALQGYLYVPDGTGPFPAILWNHGSERHPGSQPVLARFYMSHGFVFFVPHRHG